MTVKKDELKPEEGILYAVYGTLRKGCGNHIFLEDKNVEYVGHCITEPTFDMFSINDGFPGLLPQGNGAITLELYRVNCLHVEDSLDRLEGYNPNAVYPEGNMYDKDIIDTPFGPAFIYYWNKAKTDRNKPIPSGDWITYINQLKNKNEKS